MGATLQQYPPNIKAEQVQEILGIKRTCMYSLVRNGKLPKPFHIGASSFWVRDEIQAFIDVCIAKRDEALA